MTLANRTLAETTVRTAARIVGTIAPGPAGRAAFRLFCTPPRSKMLSAGEQRLAARMAPTLAEAAISKVPFDGGRVQAYSWTTTAAARRGRVLLVHGWTGRALVMMAFVQPLRAAGFDVTALDLPAHGASDGRQLNLVLGARAVQAVAADVGGVTGVITHSFGGPVAVLAAEGGLPLDRPLSVERLVLIASPNALQTVTRGFADRIALPGRAIAAMEQEIHRLAKRPVEALMVGEFLSRIAKPTLLIHDEGDADVPFARAIEISNAAPHVAVLPTTGLGHRKIVVAPRAVKAAVAFMRVDAVTAANTDAAT
jgi:pimeloyl-ACP methyl ester carboxylesterase